MSSSIWFECVSENFVRKSSRFSFGMGLGILGGSSEVVFGTFAMSVFGGICKCMGRWSEFKLIFWLVFDVYRLLLGVLMKKPSIRLFCV